MATTRYPTTGLASLTKGVAIVNGNGANFSLARPGDFFWTPASGVDCAIKNVIGDNQLELEWPWPGIGQTNQPYEIRIASDIVRMSEAYREMIERQRSGVPFRPDASGTLANRAQYDAAAAGFQYLRTDVTPHLMYVKNSASAADWSPGSPMQGAPGAAGATVPQVLAALGINSIIVNDGLPPANAGSENDLWIKPRLT